MIATGNQNPGLAGVDSNQYSTQSFTYPLSLGAPGAGLDHYMVININQNNNTGYTSATVNGSSPTAVATVNANQALDARLGIASTGSQAISRVATTIALYMPPNIIEQYTNDWGTRTLGAAEDVLGGEKSLSDIARSLGVSSLRSVGSRVGTLTNTDLNDAVSYLARVAINDHRELLYNGPEYRTFTFDFRFVPQSKAEAVNIYNIITALKFYQAPEIMQGSGGRYWLYPAEFDVTFISNGQVNDFLGKISTCALVDLKVNYSPVNEWAAFRLGGVGSPPVACEMSITLREVEFMTKQRILQGF